MTDRLEAARAEMHDLLAERAFTFGDFVLSSGRRSDFYFNGKQVTLEGRGLYLASLLILERCRELRVDAIGGLTLGADPIAAGVAALSGEREPLRAFIVRKEVKDHGTARLIEGPPLHDGDRVMVVDDVITTGGSSCRPSTLCAGCPSRSSRRSPSSTAKRVAAPTSRRAASTSTRSSCAASSRHRRTRRPRRCRCSTAAQQPSRTGSPWGRRATAC